MCVRVTPILINKIGASVYVPQESSLHIYGTSSMVQNRESHPLIEIKRIYYNKSSEYIIAAENTSNGGPIPQAIDWGHAGPSTPGIRLLLGPKLRLLLYSNKEGTRQV